MPLDRWNFKIVILADWFNQHRFSRWLLPLKTAEEHPKEEEATVRLRIKAAAKEISTDAAQVVVLADAIFFY